MANETEYRISVDLNHNQKTRSTSPSQGNGNKGNSVSGMLKGLSLKNMTLAGFAISAVKLGKTYADLQFSKAERTMTMKRINTVLNPKVLGSYPVKAMEYNNELEKRELRYDYTNQKYRQDVTGGSRWGGVR